MASLKIQYRGSTMDYGDPVYRGIGAVRKLNVKVNNSIREYGFTSNLTASIYSPTFRVNGKNCYLARDEYYNTTRESTYGTSSYTESASSQYGVSSHTATRSSGYVVNTYTYYKQTGYTQNLYGSYLTLYSSTTYTAGYECGNVITGYHLTYKPSGNISSNKNTYTTTGYTSYATNTFLEGEMYGRLLNNRHPIADLGYAMPSIDLANKSAIIYNLVSNQIRSTYKISDFKSIQMLYLTYKSGGSQYNIKSTTSITASRSSSYVKSTSPLTRSYSYVKSTSPLTRSSQYQTYSNNCNM